MANFIKQLYNKEYKRSKRNKENKSNTHGAASKPRTHPPNTLISSTTSLGLKNLFSNIVLFLAFQIDHKVACQIIKKHWRILAFLAELLNTSNILKLIFLVHERNNFYSINYH
jgi:hypothetical protein